MQGKQNIKFFVVDTLMGHGIFETSGSAKCISE
jgi:hypothetical protein